MYPEHNQLDPDNPIVVKNQHIQPIQIPSMVGKIFSERLFSAFNRNYNLNVRVARFHNIFGPMGTWNGGKKSSCCYVEKLPNLQM